jgi:hypothetical protein
MALKVKVSVEVSLPDLASFEAVGQARVAELKAQLADVQTHYQNRLKELNVTTGDIEALVRANPKLIDAQLRGKLATVARLEGEIARWQAVPAAIESVKAKLSSGANLFEIIERPWGRTRVRVYAKIADPDLQVLHSLGLTA